MIHFTEVLLCDLEIVHSQLDCAPVPRSVVEKRRLIGRDISSCFNNTLPILAVAFSCDLEGLDSVVKCESGASMRAGDIGA